MTLNTFKTVVDNILYKTRYVTLAILYLSIFNESRHHHLQHFHPSSYSYTSTYRHLFIPHHPHHPSSSFIIIIIVIVIVIVIIVVVVVVIIFFFFLFSAPIKNPSWPLPFMTSYPAHKVKAFFLKSFNYATLQDVVEIVATINFTTYYALS